MMSPLLKILAGALMIVLGVFTSITFSNQLLTMVLGGIGPLLVLVGAFIVWLESDELKVQRQEENEETTGFGGQQTLDSQEESETEERDQAEAAREIKQAVKSQETDKPSPEELVTNGTVAEVKQEVKERDDLDIQAVLQAEKNSQNRKTLVNYLERQLG